MHTCAYLRNKTHSQKKLNYVVYGKLLKILKNQGIKSSKVINQNRNTKMRKIRSGVKHTLAFLNIKRIKHYGFKIQFYQYINKLLRTNDSKFSFIVYSKYNILVERYLSKYVDKILDN